MSAAKMVADSTQAELIDADGRKRKKKIKKGGKKVVLPEDEDSDLDLKRELRPIGDFVKDRPAMIREMFRAVRGASLTRALPDLLKSIPLDELQLLCQEQLEVMSKKRIRRIIAGEESANISSSGTEDDTSDEEAANIDGVPMEGQADAAVPDMHPADSTSINQDSPRPAVGEVLPMPTAAQVRQLQKQAPPQQQPQHQAGNTNSNVASIPLPVPIEHVKQEPPDSDDNQHGQASKQTDSSQAKLTKNYRRKDNRTSSSRSRNGSRSSRSRSRSSSRSSRSSSRSSRSSSRSRSYSSSSRSSSGGRRKRGGRSSKRDRRSRRKGRKRGAGKRRHRRDDSYSDEEKTRANSTAGGVVPSAQQTVPSGVVDPSVDDDPEMYTSGSEDGELVRREVPVTVPPGVKIKTEPISDTEDPEPGEQPLQTTEASTDETKPESEAEKPGLTVQENMREEIGGEHKAGNGEIVKGDSLEQQKVLTKSETSSEKVSVEIATSEEKTDELEKKRDEGLNTEDGLNEKIEKEETVEGKEEGLTPVEGQPGGSHVADASVESEVSKGEENADDDSDDDEEDDSDEDGDESKTADLSQADLTQDGDEGEGEKEMDKMELLELEMRARAIKAMLGSQGDATGRKGQE